MRVTFAGFLTSQQVDFNIYLFVLTLPHHYLQFSLEAKPVEYFDISWDGKKHYVTNGSD